MKKVEYDKSALLFIKMMKSMGKIKSWSEASKVYYNITGIDVAVKHISTQVNNVLLKEASTQSFFDYCENTDKYLKTKEESKQEPEEVITNSSIKNGDVLIRTFNIPEKDYKVVFDIDIETDSKEMVRQKIMRKFGNDEEVALKYLGGFDIREFYLAELDLGSWTMTVKEKKKDGSEEAKIILNDKAGIKLKRRKERIIAPTREECQQFLENFLKERRLTPLDIFDKKYENNKQLILPDENLLIVSPGIELHLGKLASTTDFEDYSTKQAMYRLKEIAKEIADYQRQTNAANLVMGVGNDYFNSDTTDDKTTNGTEQNNDTRFRETYLWGKTGFIEMIEALKPFFNKIVLKGNPGNHDEKTSFSLLTNLYDIYGLTDDPKVKVGSTYKDLRYSTGYEFGSNFIVFTHGKAPKGKNMNDKTLAQYAINQFPEETRKAKNVYVIAGHLHQETEYKEGNITVLRTASPTGTDDWHYENGYLGAWQGHCIYLIDKEKGYIGKKNIKFIGTEKTKKISVSSRYENVDMIKEVKKALNLNTESIVIENTQKKVKSLNNKKNNIKRQYLKQLKEISALFGIETDCLSQEQKDEALSIMGYNKVILPIEQEKNKVKEYCKPTIIKK